MTEISITTTTTTVSTIGIVGEEEKVQETIVIIKDVNSTPIQDEKPQKKKKPRKKPSKKANNSNILGCFTTDSSSSAASSSSTTTTTTTTAGAAATARGRKEKGGRAGQGRKPQNDVFSGPLPFCPHFFSCSEQQGRHTRTYRHVCSLGQSCTQKDDPKHSRLWYHFDLPTCPNLSNCELLTDSKHRASFHHPGFADTMLPCSFYKDCKKMDDRNHLLRYQHSDPFYFPQDGVAPVPEFATIVASPSITTTTTTTAAIATEASSFPPLGNNEASPAPQPPPAEKEEKEKEEKEEKEEEKETAEEEPEKKPSAEEEPEKKEDEKEEESNVKCPIAVPAETVEKAYKMLETEQPKRERKEKKGGEERMLMPCSHPFECRLKADASHMYYHACNTPKNECLLLHKPKIPAGMDANNNNNNNNFIINNEANAAMHKHSYVHYVNEPCKEGKNCPFIYDPRHRAYFAHFAEPAFLTPCKFATGCTLMDDPSHRLRFQHFVEHYFPPFPQTFVPEYKAHIDLNNGIPLCNAFFCCPRISDPAHVAEAMHACPDGQDCPHLADAEHKAHFYHYNNPLCKDGKSCTMLTDPLHRAQFHHPGYPDFITPCGFGHVCSQTSNQEHCSLRQHGMIPILPCIPNIPVAHFVDVQKKIKTTHYYKSNTKAPGFQFNMFTPMVFYPRKKPQNTPVAAAAAAAAAPASASQGTEAAAAVAAPVAQATGPATNAPEHSN